MREGTAVTRDKWQRQKEQWARRRAASREASLQRGTEPATQQRVLEPGEMSVLKEVRYIVQRALAGEARIVTIGELFLFSTPSGDAWLLDTDDQLALCLAREGREQPHPIMESPGKFHIDWPGEFSFEGDCLVVHEGPETTCVEHPQLLAEIRAAIARVRKGRS
jgi:hypothetical protein